MNHLRCFAPSTPDQTETMATEASCSSPRKSYDSSSQPSSSGNLSTAPSSILPSDEAPFSSSTPRLDTFRWFDNVVFELNEVFLRCSEDNGSDKRLKEVKYDITTSLPWSKFEKGLISLENCRSQIVQHEDFNFSEEEVAIAMKSAMSWRVSPEMLSLISEFRNSYNIYGIGNLPQTVCDDFKKSENPLGLFTKTFLSSQLHERLPHPAIFTKALDSIDVDPQRTLYIGSHIDNVITARTFGFHSILHKSTPACIQHICHLCTEPLAKAKSWLRINAGHLDLETSLGITVKDAFQQYCILDATGDKSLIYYEPNQTLFSWYYGPIPNGLKQFPPDVDCNSFACATLDHLSDETKHAIMDEILNYVDSSGILQGYLSAEKVRVDILMCVNGLALFDEYGRGHQLSATEDWLFKVLDTRAFRDGTHYYPSADVFLYFVSRLLRKAPRLRNRFGTVLRDCVLERKEAHGDALSLACRIIAAARCGVRDDVNMEKLLVAQKNDGSWEKGVIYQFTRYEGVAWHQGLTVALAVLAVEEWDHLRKS